jgi:hypothetical protein
VVTVSVVVTAEVPVTLTDGEENVQVAPAGQPLVTLRFTVPVNPYRGVMVIAEVPDCPGAEMLTVVGFADTLKSVTVIVVGDEVEPA